MTKSETQETWWQRLITESFRFGPGIVIAGVVLWGYWDLEKEDRVYAERLLKQHREQMDMQRQFYAEWLAELRKQ